MTTSEQFWSKLLDEEIARGTVSAEGAFQDYLSIRGANNLIREDATEWIFDRFIQVARRLEQERFEIGFEKNTESSFTFLGATLIGPSISFTNGVRKLSCEIGSIKAPGHGIIKGGGLAICRIAHFGLPEKQQILRLIMNESDAHWMSDGDDPSHLHLRDVLRHFEILLS